MSCGHVAQGLLHAHCAAAALIHTGDRLDGVRAALFIADSSQALLDRGPIDAARALIRVDVVGDTAAHLVEADLPRGVLLPVAHVVASCLAIASRIREAVD